MKNKLNECANLCKTGLAIMAVSALVSCGNNKEFTSGRAEDAIEELPMFQDSANVVKLKVGYYEENDASTRYQLRQLAANEMLTYSAEQINEYIPASYWSRAKTKEHVFITVALTEKGKKYIVNEPIKDKESKELENKNKEQTYPESTVTDNEQIPLRNPQTTESDAVQGSESNSSSSYNNNNSYSSSSDSSVKEKSMYEKAKDKEHSESYNMLAYKLKVYKVKNLICTEESMKDGKASCDAILEISDSTPFGRILSSAYKGDRQMAKNIKFFYYIDKGWQVKNE